MRHFFFAAFWFVECSACIINSSMPPDSIISFLMGGENSSFPLQPPEKGKDTIFASVLHEHYAKNGEKNVMGKQGLQGRGRRNKKGKSKKKTHARLMKRPHPCTPRQLTTANAMTIYRCVSCHSQSFTHDYATPKFF